MAPAVKVKTIKNHFILYSIYLKHSILRNPSHSVLIFVSNISLRQQSGYHVIYIIVVLTLKRKYHRDFQKNELVYVDVAQS